MPQLEMKPASSIDGAPRSRTAACACGSLSITVSGEPLIVHACSCETCQRSTGSVFFYSSFFPQAAVTASAGEHRSWRRTAASGRPVESHFCPTCGATVFLHLTAFPDAICIPVGCFADPDFPPPQALCWATRRHRWFSLPPEVAQLETQ